MDGEQYTNGLKTTIAEYGARNALWGIYEYETKANLSAGVYIGIEKHINFLAEGYKQYVEYWNDKLGT